MPSSAFQAALTFPLGGPPPADAATAAIQDVLGTDILFTDGKLRTGAHGDYAEVSGFENLRRALLRRLITKPGEYRPFPLYGVGIGTYAKKPMTTSNLAELQHRILDNLSQERRIEKVLEVAVTPVTINGVPALSVLVRVQALGQSRSFEPFTFRKEVG